MNVDNFGQYKYCLQAAEKVCPASADKSKLAEIQLAWGKYFLEYFKMGKLLHEQNTCATGSIVSQNTGESSRSSREEPLFTSILPDTTPSTTPPKVDTFDDARELFKSAISHLERLPTRLTTHAPFFYESITYESCFSLRLFRAKEYYAFDGFVTVHITILQSMSECYRLLASYETDRPRKVKLLFTFLRCMIAFACA
jgi:hypothetical protein